MMIAPPKILPDPPKLRLHAKAQRRRGSDIAAQHGGRARFHEPARIRGEGAREPEPERLGLHRRRDQSETTLRRNRMALDSVAFRPRVLRDVSTVDASTTEFGRKLRLPVLLAPVGSL